MPTTLKKEVLDSGVRITMSARLENIDLVCHEVDACLKGTTLDNQSFGIQIGVREALANAVKHGSHNNPDKQIIFELEQQKSQLVITVQDEGPGFDHAARGDIDEGTLSCSGRGILIIHKYFDVVRYNEQGNRVEMVLKIKE